MEHYKSSGRIARGETTSIGDLRFEKYSDEQLILFLQDKNAQTRTSSAKILGKRKTPKSVKPLCTALKSEKCLYSKIAICNALGDIGKPALPDLIKLIGIIGGNQHTKLPTMIFKKWNYPIPRDIVARTIIKIGNPTLEDLQEILRGKNPIVIREALDAIGYISYYSSDHSSLSVLLDTLNRYEDDSIIVWKTIRALGSFPSKESINVLERFLKKSSIPTLRWEAARSLGQIGNDRCKTILETITDEKNKDVCLMVEISLKKIQKQS